MVSTGVVFLVVAIGCMSNSNGRYDPWYRPSPLEFFEGGPDKFEAVPFMMVTTNESEAVSRLSHQEWVAITEEESKKYLAASLGGTGGQLYLLRAPCLKGDPGSFTVIRRKRQGDVQVLFRRKSQQPQTPAVTGHRAVIARLPTPPWMLYPDEHLSSDEN